MFAYVVSLMAFVIYPLFNSPTACLSKIRVLVSSIGRADPKMRRIRRAPPCVNSQYLVTLVVILSQRQAHFRPWQPKSVLVFAFSHLGMPTLDLGSPKVL